MITIIKAKTEGSRNRKNSGVFLRFAGLYVLLPIIPPIYRMGGGKPPILI